MRRTFTLGIAILSLSVCAFGQGQAVPDNLPATTPATVGSIYRLLFEIDQGMPYREFIQTVPNVYTVRNPEDVEEALRRLRLKPTHTMANLSDALAAEGPFLARNREGNWILYRVRDGVLQKIDGVNRTVTGVPTDEFLKDWTHNLITVQKYTAEDLDNAPKVKFGETEHNFGEVWQGKEVTHVFGFVNEGKAPLEITNVHASCGCTAAVVSRTVIGQTTEEHVITPGPGSAKGTFEPGESGSIRVTYRTAGKRNQSGSSVTVSSNDPQTPMTVLKVSAYVKVPVEVMPTIVRFHRVSKGSDLQSDVRIRAPNDPNFKIENVSGQNPRVTWNLVPVEEGTPEEPIPSYKLQVAVDIDGVDVGTTIRDTLVLKTTSEQMPEISIPVEAMVVGELFLTPDRLTFTGNFPNRDLVRYAMLRNNGSRPIKIVEVRNEIKNLKVEVTPLEGDRHYRIMGTLSVGETPEPFEGKIVLVTDHPEQPEITIPVTYIVPPAPAAGGTPAKGAVPPPGAVPPRGGASAGGIVPAGGAGIPPGASAK